MRRYLQLLGLFIRVSIQDDAAYRTDLALQAVSAMLQVVATFMSLWVVFANTTDLTGWSINPMLVLLGVFQMMQGVIHVIIAPNMRKIMEDVAQGTLDFVLLRPINHQFYASARRVALPRLADMVVGLGVAIAGAVRLSATVSVASVLTFVVMVAAGSVIIYSFWLVLATLSFWLVRVQNIEMVFWNVFEAGRYPISIYSRPVRWMLTYVLPVAFVVTIPAQSLAGATGGPVGPAGPMAAVAALIVAPAMLAAASWFWRFGLRHYSGASA